MQSTSFVEPLIEQLVLLLNNESSLSCDNDCKDIIKNLDIFFSSTDHLKESDLDLAISILFRVDKSLLYFIDKSIQKKNLRNGLAKSIELVRTLLSKFENKLSKHILFIKDVTYKCLTNVGNVAEVKVQAYNLLTDIVLKKRLKDKDTIDLFNYFYQQELMRKKSQSQNVLEAAYELCGAIAEKYPTICSETAIKSIIRDILEELKKQMSTTADVKFHIISGCMSALNGILVNFTRDKEEAPKESELIYKYTKQACAFNDNLSRRCFQKASLLLFTKHLVQLWGWVISEGDVAFWVSELSHWANYHNRDYKYLGEAALKVFHKQVWQQLNTQPDDSISQELLTYYKSIFTNKKAGGAELQVAVEGVGELATTTNMDNVNFIFRLILLRAQSSNEDEEEGSENVPKYLESLSNICRKMKTISNDQLADIQRLAKFAIEYYPLTNRENVKIDIIQALSNTIFNLSLCEDRAIDRFLYPVVYQGVILSCGHPLEEEAAIHKEMTGQETITCKNYVPLWIKLINKMSMTRNLTLPQGVTDKSRKNILSKLYESLVKTLISILEKLDLSYRKGDTDEVESKSDPVSSLQSNNPQDHSVLCNLATLWRELLPSLDGDQLTPWLGQLLSLLVSQSAALPLVSALYKLLASVLGVATRTAYFQDESLERDSVGRCVVQHLEDVLTRCSQYKNDLQASCLQAVIAVPVQLIDSLLPVIPPVMQMIFEVGQSLIQLAHCGMDALEAWQARLSAEQLKPILNLTLPTFDPYLRSQVMLSYEEDQIKMSKKQQRQQRDLAEASQLSRLQERMMRFLSRLDPSTCLDMLKQEPAAVAWTSAPLLSLIVPFPDQRATVYLDSLLPRVVELALTCSDRQTKTSACEVLHAFVILFYGHGLTMVTPAMEQNLCGLLRRLVPALLQLACGSDLVARQLFDPLVKQMIRWHTTRNMLKLPRTEVLLDAVWEGVTDENDTALRDLSAFCLREFVEWSDKNSNEEVNVLAVMRQIRSYCTHPSLSKRIGAAVAFNHIAPLLQRKPSLVDMFWLELVVSLVGSLGLGGDCTDHPAATGLRWALLMLNKHQPLLTQESKDRRIPVHLRGSGSLHNLIRWLLVHCGSIVQECAKNCQYLVKEMVPFIPGMNLSTLGEAEDMVSVCEGGGKESKLALQPTICLADGEKLRASLDCYAWSLRQGLVPPSIIKRTPSRLVPCVEYYLHLLVNRSTPSPLSVSRSDANLVWTNCAIIINLFNFLSLLESNISFLPYTFWSEPYTFWKLVSVCVMRPQDMGFDWRSRLLADELPSKLRCLLVTLRENVKLDELYNQLSGMMVEDCFDLLARFTQACQGLGEAGGRKDEAYIQGLTVLHQTGLLANVKHGRSWDGNMLVKNVLSSLFNSDGAPLQPEPTVIRLACKLLEFAKILKADIGVVVRCVLDSTKAGDVTRGEHMLSVLSEPVSSLLLRDSSSALVSLLQDPSVGAANLALDLIKDLKYTRAKTIRSYRELVDGRGEVVVALAGQWPHLASWETSQPSGSRPAARALLIDLLKAAVHTFAPDDHLGCLARDDRLASLSTWIFAQITNDYVLLEYKPELIDLLPYAIVHGKTDKDVGRISDYLQQHRGLPAYSNKRELPTTNPKRQTFIAVYSALLRALETSGSILLLRVVARAAVDPEHACAQLIDASLHAFMTRDMNKERQVAASGVIYEQFVSSKSEDEALGLTERFLVPMLSCASKAAVSQFLADKIQFIIDTLDEDILIRNNWKCKQKMLSKIMVLQLVEVLCMRLTKADLESTEHPINKNAQVPKGDKLTKFIAAAMLKIRKTDCDEPEMETLFRKLHCCTYRAMVSFMCNTEQNENMCTAFLFKEERKMWSKLISTKPNMTFPIEFDDYPKKKKQLVQVRSLMELGAGKEGEGVLKATAPSYMPSLSLLNSSLQEDILGYDFTLYNVRDEDRMQQVLGGQEEAPVLAGLELEMDQLNSHECMAALCAAVKHMCDKFPHDPEAEPLPKWMEQLQKSLQDSDQPPNCRALILRLILNCQSYFRPWATHWLEPVLRSVIKNSFGAGVNYLIHDVIVMLADWHSVIGVPKTGPCQALVSQFLCRMVVHTPNEKNAIQQYNKDLVKLLVGMWKDCATVPYQELLNLQAVTVTTARQMDHPGLLLADVFLSNQILPFNDTGKPKFYELLLQNLEKKHKPSATVIGKILKLISKDSSVSLEGIDLDLFNATQDRISEVYKSSAHSKLQQFIEVLHKVQQHYPQIMKRFAISAAHKVYAPSSFGGMLLECLTTALQFDFRSDAFSLLHTQLPNFIQNINMYEKQIAALKFVNELMPNLTPEQMMELTPAVMSQRNNKAPSCRQVVYSIAQWIYDNYKNLQADDAKEQVKDAQTLLIFGLADSDLELRESNYKFWSSNKRLSGSAGGRLVDVLRLVYSPTCQHTLLPALVTLMLQLCQETNEYQEPIFPQDLSDIAFQKLPVSGSWRMQRAAMVPMFANTQASQLWSQTQSLGSLPHELKATMTQTSQSMYPSSLNISVTRSQESSSSLASFSSMSIGRSLSQRFKQGPYFGTTLLKTIDETDATKSQSTVAIKSKRFSRNEVHVREMFADKTRRQNEEVRRQLAERGQRREGEVRLTRQYRTGELPDIRIPCSGVLTALNSLAKRNQLIARQLIVTIHSGLKLEQDGLIVSSALDTLLMTLPSEPTVVATLIEMSLERPKLCHTSAETITDVCKKSHQTSLGALLVEAKLLSADCSDEPPPMKKGRSSNQSHSNDWIHLAEIYHAMEERDVVQGLFEERVAEACAERVRQALQAEDQGRWDRANNLYKDCLRMNQNDTAENFLFDACFNTYAHLSKWRDLNQGLKKNQLDNDLDKIWTDNWYRDTLLPWLFLSELHCSTDTSVLDVSPDFRSALASWMTDPDSSKAQLIEDNFGDRLSVVQALSKEVERSRVTCDHSRQRFLERWALLDPLSCQLRAHHLQSLHPLMDIYHFVTLKRENVNEVEDLISQWQRTSPSEGDNLVAWETRAAYRQILTTLLDQSSKETSLCRKLQVFQRETHLKTLECGLKQRNYHIANKYLLKYKVKDAASELSASRCRLLRAQMELDAHSQMTKALNAWNVIDEMKGRDSLDTKLKHALHCHSAEYFNILLSAVESNSSSVMQSLPESDRENLARHIILEGDVRGQLISQVVASLQQAVDVAAADSLADSYLKLACFCHQNGGADYESRLVESLLRAMRHGSAEARRLFPCLLQLPLLDHRDLFIAESDQVPVWMFLSWVSQLLASLATPVGAVLAPLVVRLAKTYPEALKFPFQLSRESYKNAQPHIKAAVQQLETLVALDTISDNLVRSLACVCHPHHCLFHHINQLRTTVYQDEDAFIKACALMKIEAYPAEKGDAIKGDAFKDVEKFTKEIDQIISKFSAGRIGPQEVADRLNEVRNQVRQHRDWDKTKTKHVERILLVKYSPWLVRDWGASDTVELPGQYSGHSRPRPASHVTIAGFMRNVKPFQSVQAPIQITILGNDAKNYPFLVKFGEDLRQDQRIQQLLGLMNQLFSGDATRASNLSVDTYIVCPLSSRLGIIGWVEDTNSLHDFMVTEENKTKESESRTTYNNYFQKSISNFSNFYSKGTRRESIAVYNRAVNQVPKLMLRDAIQRLAVSPEAFMHLRAQFVSSHACLSVCHWLLGVGDRHLQNSLVNLRTCRVVGIDFGHAFGTATQLLPIPELVPIRLSPQIVNASAPLGTCGLLKESMVHALQVLRANKQVLVATMDVFIQEPAIDWASAAKKRPDYQGSQSDWLPREKIALVRRKLDGADPRAVMAEDLATGHQKKPYFRSMKELLMDGWQGPDSGLTPRLQVESLIAHATNEHILSKTYSGWTSWL